MSRSRGSPDRSIAFLGAQALAGFGIVVAIPTLINSALTQRSGQVHGSTKVPTWFWIATAILVTAVALAIFLYLFYNLRLRFVDAARARELMEKEEQAVESALDRLRERMTLPSLVELNRISLGRYHNIATTQADKSFRSSQRAMWSGLVWLLICFSAALVMSSLSNRILLGSLAAIGGSLSGFLGRTYLRVYERSLQQLTQFYNQPLLNSYYLTAERLASDMGGTGREKAMGSIVDELLKGAFLLSEGTQEPRKTTVRRSWASPATPTSPPAEAANSTAPGNEP
jgi:hypothetical protein